MSENPETPITPGSPTPENTAENTAENAPENGVPTPPAETAPTVPIAPPAPAAETAPTVPIAPATPAAETAPTTPLPPLTPAAATAPTTPLAPPVFGAAPSATGAFGQDIPPVYPAPAAPAAAREPRKRSTATIVVAALAIGAIVGGVSGAGVTLLATNGSNAGSPTSATVDPTTINVNNPDDATTVTAVAAKASPSVVTISVSTSSEGGTGSGVILSDDGYILTNTHVVTLDGASSDGAVQVTLNDGRIFSAKVIGTDPVSDLAVVKIDATGLTAAEFADSSKLNVGDTAVAIGAPLGLSGTVTDGIVSALNRSITIQSSAVPDDQSSSQDGSSDPGNLFGFDLPGSGSTTQSSATISIAVIQTDAAINPGNSGGALLNAQGQVIGINVAIASASSGSTSDSQSGSIGVGFSIPSNLAQRVAKELMKDGAATHGLLGASIANDTSASGTGSTTSTQSVAGAVVSDVTSGGSAEAAGIKKDDIITKFNGIPITDYTDLIAQVRALAAGSTAKVTYVRDGAASEVDVTLGALK